MINNIVASFQIQHCTCGYSPKLYVVLYFKIQAKLFTSLQQACIEDNTWLRNILA